MAWWPGWDSISSASAWSHFWFWVGLACLIGLAAAGTLSHVYGLRKAALIEVADAISFPPGVVPTRRL